MKKYFLQERRKIFRIFLLLFVFTNGLFLFQLNAQDQKTKLNLKCQNEALSSVLKKVEQISQFKVLFTYNDVQDFQVTVDLKAKNIEETMQAVLDELPFVFTIKDKYVSISKRKEQDKKTLSGTVSDNNGNLLPGVNIKTNEASIVGVTGEDGRFNIEIPKGKKITTVNFSFIGMETLAVVYHEKPLLVSLKNDNKTVEEVVITGIFERKAESFTGAATVIKKEELMRNGSQNLLQNLKNIDPSFRIVENLDFGSDPNRMPEVQLRGQQSIPDLKGSYTGNPNQPLFILDGFEADITRIFDLDMNRVETVVLLKDAAAKAIYGARAANGVVVIETQKPKPGKLKMSYKGDLNITIPDLNGYNLSNAREKYEIETVNLTNQDFYFKERYLNSILGEVARGVDTYWLSKPLHVGVGQRHSAYLEGGDDRIHYGVDLLYNNVSGIMKGSQRNTFTGGFSLSYRYKDFLFRNQFSVSQNKADDSPYGSFSEYTSLNPYWTAYERDGSLKQILGTIGGGGYIETPIGNPLWNAQVGTKNFSKYTNLVNNFYIEWQALNSLKITGRLGVTKNDTKRDDFFPASHTRFAGYAEDRFFERGSYNKGNGEQASIRSDLNANYSLLLNKHQLYLNAGANIQENSANNVDFSVVGFPNDRMSFIAAGKEYPMNSRPTGNESISREIGFLSALNYSYDDRYLADLSIRSTGSSMFGKEKRWGQFWSSGIGWNVHKEHFMQDANWLKQLKLRASTGYTGSQNFNPYQALATFGYYQSQAYDNWVGSYLLGLPNDDLKWQKTQDYNMGVDMNLWGWFMLRYDYYVQNTKDQLLNLTIPPSMGFTTYKENLGNTQNKGMELKLNAQLLKDAEKQRYLSVFMSMATNSNKIMKISNALQSFNDANNDQLQNGDYSAVKRPLLQYVEGQSMNAIWTVKSLGIDPATGDEIFLTKDGRISTKWNAADQIVSGDAMPKYTGNAGFNLDYRGIFLNMTLTYQFAGQIYNQTLVDRVENAYIYLNVDKRIDEAVWKQADDRVAFSYNRFKTTKPSSRFVQDLNELRLSVLNVGYDFKNSSFLKNIGLSQLKTSFYMNDVFRVSSVQIERGLDYPFARTYSFSLQGTF